MASLAGQVALITGASSGIGAALARELVRRGVDVALAARRVDRLEALASELRARGRRALVLSCDVTRDGDCEAAVARAVAELGHLDIAVANAGFGVRGAVEALSLDDYRRQLETNVFGVLRTARAALPELRRTRGRLAVMGSVSGWIATPGASPYAMSKHAVRALAYALGHELAASGVSVTHLSPGFVESEIHQVDNRGVLHPDVRHPTAWLRMPADRAARQIASAIAARRRERVITGHGRAAVFLERHAPWLIATALRRGGIRARPEPRNR
jgi:short-subunit dehydrogenase